MEKKKEKLYFLVSNVLIILICFSVFFIAYKSNDSIFTNGESSAIYNGNKEKNNISLMINIYWGTEYLDDILQVLEENNVKVTFFVGGSWASENTKMLSKIYGLGHEIGSHGYSHLDHSKLDLNSNLEEIKTTHKLIKTFINYDMNLFAPPSGAFNNETLKAANSLNYKTIMWSKDTIDWRDKDTNLILKRATKNLSNGDLILMHPTKCTLEALPQIIENIISQGFNLVTVSENIG